MHSNKKTQKRYKNYRVYRPKLAYQILDVNDTIIYP